MAINSDELRSLPPEDKLRLVELIWDDLGESSKPIPLPDWVDREAVKRREEMRNPAYGLSHEEAWKLIDRRHG